MKAKVLLLEDDMVLQEIIAECLEEEGYAVVCCSDGTEAMDKVYEEHFDILLLDVMVSGQNGFEALRSIRQSGNQNNIHYQIQKYLTFYNVLIVLPF